MRLKNKMNLDNAIKKFDEFYGAGEKRLFFSPGRINLIGEHLDYNGGHVLPAAIDKGIYFIVRKRNDSKLNLCSLNMNDSAPHSFADYKSIDNKNAQWLVYPRAVMNFLSDKNITLDSGFDLLLWADLPNAAGVSSSAALLVGFLYMVDRLYKLNFEKLDYAVYARAVENDYIGLHCGIMDQFAVAFGKKNHAIFLDTKSLDYQYIPADLKDYKIVVIDSNKKRELIKSEYNNRKAECEQALKDVQKKYKVDALAEFNLARLGNVTFTSDIISKRAHYVIAEEERVLKSCDFLTRGELGSFADEMNESHIGLRDLYEVTGDELDCLFNLALKHGASGARMTGAGFGGCTINLVKADIVDDFIDKVVIEYKQIIGYDARAFVTTLGDGTKEL